MFEELENHKFCDPTVFAELLMGYSPHSMMPPSEVDPIMQILARCDLRCESSKATTEQVYGAGLGSEYGQGGRHA